MAPVKFAARVGDQDHEVTIERDDGRYVVEVDDVRYVIDAQPLEGDVYSIITESGRSYEISVEAQRGGYRVRRGAAELWVSFTDPALRAREQARHAEGPEKIVSAMPGKVVRVLVREGDEVEAGQGVAVVEAMKMENEVSAPKPGRVRSVAVEAGQSVESGGVLVVIE